MDRHVIAKEGRLCPAGNVLFEDTPVAVEQEGGGSVDIDFHGDIRLVANEGKYEEYVARFTHGTFEWICPMAEAARSPFLIVAKHVWHDYRFVSRDCLSPGTATDQWASEERARTVKFGATNLRYRSFTARERPWQGAPKWLKVDVGWWGRVKIKRIRCGKLWSSLPWCLVPVLQPDFDCGDPLFGGGRSPGDRPARPRWRVCVVIADRAGRLV
jgi:hypothetical protein